jgi:soluble lytic murein transglycosylase
MYYNSLKSEQKKRKRRFLLISAAAIIIFFAFLLIRSCIHRTFLNIEDRYDSIIIKAAKRCSIDPLLVKAVIWRESNFNPDAVGAKGEIGLMQLMPNSSVKDWSDFTKREITNTGILFKPELNIEIGTWYLARSKKPWLNYNDSTALALASYNAGYSNVKKWIPEGYQGNNAVEFIKFPSTKKYVKSILDKYHSYELNSKSEF